MYQYLLPHIITKWHWEGTVTRDSHSLILTRLCLNSINHIKIYLKSWIGKREYHKTSPPNSYSGESISSSIYTFKQQWNSTRSRSNRKEKVREKRSHLNPWTLSSAKASEKRAQSFKMAENRVTRSTSPPSPEDSTNNSVLPNLKQHITPQPRPTILKCSHEAKLEEKSNTRLSSSNSNSVCCSFLWYQKSKKYLWPVD